MDYKDQLRKERMKEEFLSKGRPLTEVEKQSLDYIGEEGKWYDKLSDEQRSKLRQLDNVDDIKSIESGASNLSPKEKLDVISKYNEPKDLSKIPSDSVKTKLAGDEVGDPKLIKALEERMGLGSDYKNPMSDSSIAESIRKSGSTDLPKDVISDAQKRSKGVRWLPDKSDGKAGEVVRESLEAASKKSPKVSALSKLAKLGRFGKALPVVGNVASAGFAAKDVYDMAKKRMAGEEITPKDKAILASDLVGILPGIGNITSLGAAAASLGLEHAPDDLGMKKYDDIIMGRAEDKAKLDYKMSPAARDRARRKQELGLEDGGLTSEDKKRAIDQALSKARRGTLDFMLSEDNVGRDIVGARKLSDPEIGKKLLEEGVSNIDPTISRDINADPEAMLLRNQDRKREAAKMARRRLAEEMMKRNILPKVEE